MTGSARRLPNGRSQLRLSPRTRAAVVAMRASRHRKRRPGRAPVGKLILALLATVVLAFGSTGGAAVVVGTGVIGSLSADLPDPTNLEGLSFAQPTIIYDRTGTVELARFEREKRRVVSYSEVPRLILDTTTTAPRIAPSGTTTASIRRPSPRRPCRTRRARSRTSAGRRRSPSSSCARDSCRRGGPVGATATCARSSR